MSQSRMLETARTICSEDQIQEEALKILEPGNGFLQDLVDQFCRTWAKTRITPVACFYELKPSDVGTMMGGKASNVRDLHYDLYDLKLINVLEMCRERGLCLLGHFWVDQKVFHLSESLYHGSIWTANGRRFSNSVWSD